MSRKRRGRESQNAKTKGKESPRRLHKKRVRASQRALAQLEKFAADLKLAIATAKATLRGVLAVVVQRREGAPGVFDIFFGARDVDVLNDVRHAHAVIANGTLIHGRAWGKKRPPWTQKKYGRLSPA